MCRSLRIWKRFGDVDGWVLTESFDKTVMTTFRQTLELPFGTSTGSISYLTRSGSVGFNWALYGFGFGSADKQYGIVSFIIYKVFCLHDAGQVR